MDSRGRIFAPGEPGEKSALLARYEELRAKGFAELSSLSEPELDWLQAIHDKHLQFYKEERRMHFGAFALVGLALVILLSATLSLEQYFLPLAAIEVLLLILMVPYTFVYRRYEEGVRLMMKQSLLLENERQLRREKPGT
jgi:hypothetical protein